MSLIHSIFIYRFLWRFVYICWPRKRDKNGWIINFQLLIHNCHYRINCIIGSKGMFQIQILNATGHAEQPYSKEQLSTKTSKCHRNPCGQQCDMSARAIQDWKRISSHLQWSVLSNHVQGVQGLAEAIHLKPEHYECFPCSIVQRNSNKTMMNIIKHCCANLSDVVWLN